MNWGETFRTGWAAVRAHRLRSALTMLGILIGIAAVMLTVGLGLGAQATISAQINALGSNLLIVTPGSTITAGGLRGGAGTASTLTETDAAALADRTAAPDIAAVAPTVQRSATLTADATNWTTAVVGTSADWAQVRARTPAAGRFLTQADIDARAPVVVLGPTTAQELFGDRPAVGREVVVAGVPMTVVGELAPAGASATANQDDTAIVPITTAADRIVGGTGRGTIQAIFLQATSTDTLSAAYQEANALLTALHRVEPANPDFTITSQQAVLDTANAITGALTAVLAGIAGISLLVGGIGVMNIMLVSVTERVREIGLRKALGATPTVIRRQFLVEAGVLGLAGGVAGAVLGVVGAALLSSAIGQPVVISLSATALAIAVSVGIGLVFGVYPASRAARLAPIDALRSE